MLETIVSWMVYNKVVKNQLCEDSHPIFVKIETNGINCNIIGDVSISSIDRIEKS